jgi:hypothetical protein
MGLGGDRYMDMNKEVGYWVRYMFAKEWGSHCVAEWTMVPAKEYRSKQIAKYGYEIWADEDWNEEMRYENQVAQGATHVIRVLLGQHCGLCDGVDLYLALTDEGVTCITEIDTPDWQGGDWKDSLEWLSELAEPIDA